jgi:RimJ/RimL family protein N-acetyltransferase
MPTLNIEDILTPRLALIAITPEMLKAEQSGDPRFQELLACTIPQQWPPEHWEPHVFDFLLEHYARDPETIGWTRFVALREPDGTRTLAGTVGGFAHAACPDECEIGYSILPQFEGRGLITEAAQAFIQRIIATGRFSSIIAHTFPWLGGSIRVMEKCGLTYDGPGEEQGTIRYRMRL